MVISNDVFDNQFQACSGSVNPTSESVLQIRIKTRFVGMGESEGTAVPGEAHAGCGKDTNDLT